MKKIYKKHVGRISYCLLGLFCCTFLPSLEARSMMKDGTKLIKSERVITVKGTVRDKKDGSPLPGVSVKEKGASNAISTNSQGQYQITVQDGATLSFASIGYKTVDVIVNGRNTIDISLQEDAGQLDDVVVTGMGTQVDKRTFTGATSRLKVSDAEIGGLPDPSRMLDGKVAGVVVQNTTGTFGTAPKIRVRGATSIYGSSKPLWVVDGVILEDVADISSDALSSGDALTLISSAVGGLNSNDIESFQILKDGAATSIYGAKGMGGVIVITTKRGRVGVNSLNYVSEFTTRAIPSYNNFNIMNSQEQMGVYQMLEQRGWLNNSSVSNAPNSGVYGKMYQLINSGQLLNTQEAKNAYLREAEYRNTDWFDELFSTNIAQNHSISMSSGTEKAQYFSSLSAITDPGWSKQSKFKRYTANFNATYNLRDNLKLTILSNGSYRDQRAPGTLGQSTDVVFGTVGRDFDINPFSYALNSSRTLDPNETYTRNYAPFNILKEMENNYMDVNVADVKFQGELRWKALKTLDFGFLASTRYQQTSQQHYIKDESNQAMAYRAMGTTIIRDANPYLYTDPSILYAVPVSILPSGGIYNRTDYKMTSNDFRLTAQYNETFADKHTVDFVGGSTLSEISRNNNWNRGWGLQYGLGEIPFTDYRVFKRGAEENTEYFRVGNTRSKEVAFFGEGAYTYDNRYTIKATGRYEGSNRLGRSTSARWLPTWSVSGLWNVMEEKFFQELNTPFSNLSLKGSYGLSANRGPSYVTNSQAIYSSYNPWRPTAGDRETGLQIDNLENSDLTFEKKHELNLGASLGLFKNRLAIDVDWYKRNNFDLIGIVNTQGLGGEITKYGNVAAMKSSGIEVSIAGTVLKKGDFSWTANFIYTHATNKVTESENNARVIDYITGTGYGLKGYPARSLFSIPFVRIQNDGLPVFINDDGTETVSGVYLQNRDKVDFLKYEGTLEPTHLGSFGNIFAYKNFKLNVFVTYSYGNVVRLDPAFRTGYTDLDANTREFFDAWTVPGDELRTNVPVILDTRYLRNDSDYSIAYNSYNYSSANVAKGDFIRLKDISLGYDFPKAKLAKLGLANLGLRLNATNLWLLYADKKLNGQDPEFVNAGGVALPIPKQYTLTLRVGF
ncbi:SusC/RagA family TonB-linked outer membrane protein [Pedobacter sp. MC2016-05]|uniref:SusC/RagA family TonB-linked outer membrane protein n=1 Tax=Pedobacter sp. MC2016-05 TaxID=2994474 RepID=UPI0022467BF6|nr:SusC/RagA family TonB-linked outer membrane protein [Pedobacter sp. MC2016-05]MCX2474164.1 SusC/RagA family TonB-linked outer membrane protein [Pedobacter sp. MC2016-05]